MSGTKPKSPEKSKGSPDGKKKKGKKKSKKAKEEEEQRKREEEARREEEERQRQEEEARQRREEDNRLEKDESERLQREATRRAEEAAELRTFMRERQSIIDERRRKDGSEKEWERFLKCDYLPHPLVVSDMNTYEIRSRENLPKDPEQALVKCEDDFSVIHDIFHMLWGLSDVEQGLQLHEYASRMRELVALQVDSATANLLQNSDKYFNTNHPVIECSQPRIKLGVWVNLHRNPRFKTIEMRSLGLTAELPRPVVLNFVATRFLYTEDDPFSERCRNGYLGLGGVLTVDLLSMPPPPKHSRGWTMRQVTQLAQTVQKLPYPIPPAGADKTQPSPSRGSSSPPPMALSYEIPEHVLVVDPDDVQVGWWDGERSCWQTEGITDVRVEKRTLSFHTTHVSSFALIQSRLKLLPYDSWTIRPTQEMDAATVALRVKGAHLSEPVQLEVTSSGCSFVSPALSELAGLKGKPMAPASLLAELSRRGVHLMPEPGDAERAGIARKNTSMERFACFDIALLAGSLIIAGSKWNRRAGPEDAFVRVREVEDFDFTNLKDAEKSMQKERGDVRSLVYKPWGCAAVDALDSREELSEHLRWQLTVGRDHFGKDAARLRHEQGVEPLEMHPSALIALRDKVSSSAVTRVHMTDAVFTENLRQLMLCLALFSFG